jgi:hypothetical protein
VTALSDPSSTPSCFSFPVMEPHPVRFPHSSRGQNGNRIIPPHSPLSPLHFPLPSLARISSRFPRFLAGASPPIQTPATISLGTERPRRHSSPYVFPSIFCTLWCIPLTDLCSNGRHKAIFWATVVGAPPSACRRHGWPRRDSPFKRTHPPSFAADRSPSSGPPRPR